MEILIYSALVVPFVALALALLLVFDWMVYEDTEMEVDLMDVDSDEAVALWQKRYAWLCRREEFYEWMYTTPIVCHVWDMASWIHKQWRYD